MVILLGLDKSPLGTNTGRFLFFVLIILYSLYVEYDSPLIPSASRLAAYMAEPHS